MKNKQTWLIVILVALGAFWIGSLQSKRSVTPAISHSQPLVLTTLSVQKVPTTFGLPGDNQTYPPTISVTIPQQYKGQLSAYGLGVIVLGPTGWTGSASEGADGSGGGEIYPTNGSSTTSPNITFGTDGNCAGCTLTDAASYFPNARTLLSKTLPGEQVKIPSGLKTQIVSPSLVRYTLPNTSNGLVVNGVAYFNQTNLYFEYIQVSLPTSQKDLSDFILNSFISMQKLK